MELKSSPLVHRYRENPILSRENIPYESVLVFNAGVTKYAGKYVMVFRNDTGAWGQPKITGIHLGLAFSDDGLTWQVEPEPILDIRSEEIDYVYDSRLTVIKGKCYICFAINTKHGMRGCIAVTEDFSKFDILHKTVPDNRNLVLFPETFGGKYLRLERPFPIYSRGHADRFDIWISDSPDLRYWGNSDLLLTVEEVPFANEKIGPGAPPIKTEKGWLVIFHAVDTDAARGKNGWESTWKKRYSAGVMLLDLDDPRKVIGLYREPLLAPEAPYEIEGGFRNHVIFPCGAVLEDNGELKIYYGAADTVLCMASAPMDDLISLCTPYRRS